VDELIAFWKARLDEDEASAKAAAVDVKRFAGRANWSAELAPIVIDAEDPDWAIVDLSPFVDDECLARHIARHDPARVLREVAAKREILAEYEAAYRTDLGVAIKALAAVDSGHPDYRQEWKP